MGSGRWQEVTVDPSPRDTLRNNNTYKPELLQGSILAGLVSNDADSYDTVPVHLQTEGDILRFVANAQQSEHISLVSISEISFSRIGCQMYGREEKFLTIPEPVSFIN